MNDFHRFSATNEVVLRLKNQIYQRSICNYDFVENDFRLYSFVHDAESEFFTNSKLPELQAGTETNSSFSESGSHGPMRPEEIGLGPIPRTSCPPAEDFYRDMGSFSSTRLEELLSGLGNYSDSTQRSPSERANFFWLHVECAMTLYTQLKIAKNWQDIYLAVTQYMRAVTGKSLIMTACSVADYVVSMIQDLMATQVQGDGEDENPFTRFRKWLNLCETAANHPVVIRIKKIFYYIMSYSLLERFGITFDKFFYQKAEAELIKSQHSSDQGFFYTIVEGASFILERLYD